MTSSPNHRSKRTEVEPTGLPPQAVLLHLLVVVALVLAPLLTNLPIWIVLATFATLSWRAGVVTRGWPLPGLWLCRALAVAAVAGVYASFGHVTGLAAGAGLLTIATALKLVELRQRRDLRVVIAILYFTLAVHFLFSQALWTIFYLLVCTWAITAILIESNHPDGVLPVRTSLRLAGLLTMQALPLMIVLFILFPRIPGPLWGLPADSGATRSGLADSMAPGDIRRMILSDAVAFRVRFFSPPPPQQERYWRGPVFSVFDGHHWRPNPQVAADPPQASLGGEPVRYRITLEPSRSRWLFALDLPSPAMVPPDAALDGDDVLQSATDNRERRAYTLISYPRYTLQPTLSQRERRKNLQLPARVDPKTRALAHRWRAQGLSDTEVVAAALRMFHTQDFHYTLRPPPLGRNTIDDFLFRTRAGFCEHYASSFTFLMRAAGVPARVVTGYQGGTRNAVGDYTIVRDADAHAWSEVWLNHRGWVREDPTAAVAPSRIDDGINAALAGMPGLPAFLTPQWQLSWRHAIDARWDWVNMQWYHWVLGYGPDMQNRLMNLLGLFNWRDMILALTACVTLILATIGLTLLPHGRRVLRDDAALRSWQRATRRLRRLGLIQKPGEGPQDFSKRVCAARPELSSWMRRLCAAYLRARYLDAATETHLAALRRSARAPR